MNNPEINYLKDESYKLLGAAFEVYKTLGHGLAEEIYQEAMEIELELQGIPFRAKQPISCFYKSRKLKKHYEPDLIVFKDIVVELKSVSQMPPDHEAQLINYLRITKQPLGYLINFGKKGGVDLKRFVLSEFLPV